MNEAHLPSKRQNNRDRDTRRTATEACVHARLYESVILSFNHPVFIFLSPKHTLKHSQTHTDTDSAVKFPPHLSDSSGSHPDT